MLKTSVLSVNFMFFESREGEFILFLSAATQFKKLHKLDK